MKKRETTRWIKERKDKEGNLLCLVPTCNNLREKYKKSNKTRNYCKDHTFSDMAEFTNWPSLRAKALKRDNYTCVKCSDNREEVVTTIKSKRIINWDDLRKGLKVKYESFERKEMRNNLIGDHIIPISLGGDEFDLNNVQTLCLKCNKEKTKQDAKDIAKQRKLEKKNPNVCKLSKDKPLKT